MTGDRINSTPAGEQGTSASQEAYPPQRLQAGGTFHSGRHQDHPAGTVALTPAPAAPRFRPVLTHQGVVTSFRDAEWLLVRTAARIAEGKELGFHRAYPPDQDDQGALASALSESCDLPAHEILSRLAPQIATRVEQMKQGPAVAAELGRKHGATGTPPHCDLDIDGDSAPLMSALGETEWLTDANHPYRMALVVAYVEGYRDTSPHRTLDARQARVAASSFPPSLTGQKTAPPVQGRPPEKRAEPCARQNSSPRQAR
jgi:hypothetical protein